MSNLQASNIAIVILGYCRPEFLADRVSEISSLGAQNVFISIDGPKNSEVFSSQIEDCQEVARQAALNFGYSVMIHPQNLGLSRHVTETISNILLKFEWVVVIEDDIRLSQNSLQSFYEGIRIAKESGLNGTVGGFSFYGADLSIHLSRLNFWRTSRYFSAWGWAINRKSWNFYSLDISNVDIENTLKDSKTWAALNRRQQQAWLSKFRKVKEDPSYTWDFQMVYASFVNDWRHLLPVFRFVDNVGFDDLRGTHTRGKKPKNLLGDAGGGIVKNSFTNFPFHNFFSWIDSNTWILDDPRTIKRIQFLGKLIKSFTKER